MNADHTKIDITKLWYPVEVHTKCIQTTIQTK